MGIWAQGSQPCSVKIIIVTKSKAVKTVSNLAESCKESYDLKSALLPMMTAIIFPFRQLRSK
jgi:hypothetical protein